MAHDQLFKELLRQFFAEFLQLFYPDVAARLDFTDVAFLDKDLYTDLPGGKRREPDLVARVQTTTGASEIVLIHVEVQRQRRRNFGMRMAEYCALLRLRHRVPVFPIVIYLQRGTGGLGQESYQELVFDRPVLSFDYYRVGVPDLPAEEYLQTDNELAYGLAALMRPGPRGRVETKVECLIRIARAVRNEARKVVLANCVETYLPLDTSEQRQFEEIMGSPAFEEVTKMLSIYEIRGEERGIAKGALQAKRDMVLRLLAHKFKLLPESVRDRVQSMSSEAELDDLSEAILDAATLDDLGLATGGQNGHAA